MLRFPNPHSPRDIFSVKHVRLLCDSEIFFFNVACDVSSVHIQERGGTLIATHSEDPFWLSGEITTDFQCWCHYPTDAAVH